MKTFSIQTLGCKVNHYEGEQIAQLLRRHGLEQVEPALADLRIVNTCSVTTAAASQSRQSVRRVVRLPQLPENNPNASARPTQTPQLQAAEANASVRDLSGRAAAASPAQKSRVLVTGCWATSDGAAARALAGVDAAIGHHDNVAAELERLLTLWQEEDKKPLEDWQPEAVARNEKNIDGWIVQAGAPEDQLTSAIKPSAGAQVNLNFVDLIPEKRNPPGSGDMSANPGPRVGTAQLPLLGHRQPDRQRAFLKIQDGCDAHCTYCIIPSLRPGLWSKPIEEVVAEATALVKAGHVEIILTGIFLGAYGQPTALRRRQSHATAKPLGQLVHSLCTRVPDLRRLRLSSLEPGDLTDELIDVLRSHPQVVPHFHLPLQSGSDYILHRMNRQYTAGQFVEMVDRLRTAFDRPALTTDVVVGFPGEEDEHFEQTANVVERSQLIHVHAFPYSPRPGTAAARWKDRFVNGTVSDLRIKRLTAMAEKSGIQFRESFIGQIVEVIVERDPENLAGTSSNPSLKHGRCERYFSVYFDDARAKAGDSVKVRVARVTSGRTFGDVVGLQVGIAESRSSK